MTASSLSWVFLSSYWIGLSWTMINKYKSSNVELNGEKGSWQLLYWNHNNLANILQLTFSDAEWNEMYFYSDFTEVCFEGSH